MSPRGGSSEGMGKNGVNLSHSSFIQGSIAASGLMCCWTTWRMFVLCVGMRGKGGGGGEGVRRYNVW